MPEIINLNVPRSWLEQFDQGAGITDDDAERFASALADELLAEMPEGHDNQVVYWVVDHDGYGTRPTASNWEITSEMIERALKAAWDLRM